MIDDHEQLNFFPPSFCLVIVSMLSSIKEKMYLIEDATVIDVGKQQSHTRFSIVTNGDSGKG